MKELTPRITENGIDYILIGDYYYPDLKLPEDEEPHYGKYGRMRLDFLKEHRKGLYSVILFEGRLVTYLNEIDDIANDRMDTLVQKMAKQQGVTETMKSEDWLGWLGKMNNIQQCAEEIILEEVIFV